MERAFRLAGLLRLRKLEEDQAAARLAAANLALRMTQAHRDGARAAFAEHTMPDGDHRTWGAAVAARVALGSRLGEAAEAVGGAHERVRVDTSGWSATRARSVGLEKLEDKHRVLVQHEGDRLEQIVLDEIASRGAHRAPGGRRRGSAVGER